MQSPLVSVIIPTFNRAYCLKDSIKSVLNQKGFELIVVNDGSKDDTDKILENFPEIKVIKYFHQTKIVTWVQQLSFLAKRLK